MKEPSRIDFANTLRGFAAIIVMISHYIGTFMADRASLAVRINANELPLSSHPMPSYLEWYFLVPVISWPSYAVALFFLISGFVIPFSLYKLNGVGFLVNRLFRILPTYIVGFTCTLLALWASSHYFGKPWPYTQRDVLIHYIPGIRDLLWSPHIDGIVWTLEIEMKFYVLCALMIGWFRRGSLKVLLLPVLLFAAALWIGPRLPLWTQAQAEGWKEATTYMGYSQYIIFMFIGVMFHYLHRGFVKADRAFLCIGVLFALFAIHWHVGPYAVNVVQLWSYGAALLTFSFAFSFQRYFASNRLFAFLADISYPLYVVHGIAGYVGLRILLDLGVKAWVSLLVVVGGAIGLSWLLHIAVERPTRRLGKYLGEKVSGVRQKA